MKTKHLIFLLLLPLFTTGQVTFPSPETIATKKYVDSLVTKRLENLGGSEKPEDKPCKHPLRIDGIFSVTQAGLTYRFDSEGVKQIRETIRDAAGKTVWTHYSNPTWNTIPIYFDLKPGMYSLALENTACVAVDTAVFAIPAAGTEEPGTGDPDPPVGGEGFVNPGVFSEKVGGLLYEWIPSEGLDVQIRDGKVRLICPETKKSFDGSNTCRRYLLGDLYDNRLPANEEAALFGEGLVLPLGNYAFKVVYLNAPTWEKARKEMWRMVGVGGEWQEGYKNSGQVETVQISVTSASPIAGLSSQHFRAAWIPQFHYLGDKLSLPANKAFGVTRYCEDVPKQKIFEKVTHLQAIYYWMDWVPQSRMWRNIQDLRPGGGSAGVEWTVANASTDLGFITLSEYTENCGKTADPQDCYNQSEEIFRQIFERQKREHGISSPSQTWLIEDYFSHMYGGSAGISFADVTGKQRIEGLSSVGASQKRIYDGKWIDTPYFTHGWNQYRGFIANGYTGPLLAMAGQPNFWARLYNWERANLGAPNNRKIAYVTNGIDALQMDAPSGVGAYLRLKLEGGEMMFANALQNPFNTFLTDTFFSLLYGNGTIIWESNTPLNSDPYAFRQSWYGANEPEPHKTKWKRNGASVETYVPGQHGAPPLKTNSIGQFPEKPMSADQGGWIGAKLYEGILGRISVLTYPDFEYNGKAVKAKRGEKGQVLNANGIQNPGQDQLVRLFDAELPLCILGEGSEGKCVIFQNPNAGLTGVSNVLVEGRSFTFTGNRLNVALL